MQLGDGERSIEIIAQRLDDFPARDPAIAELAADAVTDLAPALERRARLFQALLGPSDRLAIVRTEHVESYHLARPVLQQIVDRDEVAERLAHLLAFDLQEAVMQPEARHQVGAVRAARLRNLVLVVGEHEVDAA